jgi:hypothetical protein
MPFAGDFETFAGTRLFGKLGLPTDDTEAAFETFFAAAGVAEATVTKVGTIKGRESNTTELDVVSQGLVRQGVGNYKLPTSEWEILEEGPDGTAEFFDLVDDALRDPTKPRVSFAAVRQSGAVLYWTAKPSNLSEPGGGSNDNLVYAMTLLFQSEAITAVTPVIPTIV